MTQTEIFALIDSWDISLLEQDYLKYRAVKPAPGNRRKRLKVYGLNHLKRALDVFAGRTEYDDLPKLSKKMHGEAAQGLKTLLDGVTTQDPAILIFLADYVLSNPPAGVVPYLQGKRSSPPEGYEEFLERIATRYQVQLTSKGHVRATVLVRLEGWKQYLLGKKDSDRVETDAKVTAVAEIFDTTTIDYTVESVDRFCDGSQEADLIAAWSHFKHWCLNLGGGLPLPNEPDPVPAPAPTFVPDPVAPTPKDPDPHGLGDVFATMDANKKPLVAASMAPLLLDEDGEEVVPPPKGQPFQPTQPLEDEVGEGTIANMDETPPKGQPLYESTQWLEGSLKTEREDPKAGEEVKTLAASMAPSLPTNDRGEPNLDLPLTVRSGEPPVSYTTQNTALVPPDPEPIDGRLDVVRKMRETLTHLSAAQAKLGETQAEIAKTLEKFGELMEAMLSQ